MHYMEAAFGPAEETHRRGVLKETYGHLAPNPNERYSGAILFIYGCFGDIEIVNYRFQTSGGNELESSPWLFEDMHEHVGEIIDSQKIEPGSVCVFRGTYTRSPDSSSPDSSLVREGDGVFEGTTTTIEIDF